MPHIPEHVIRELRAISPQLRIRNTGSDRHAVIEERTRSGKYKTVMSVKDNSGRPCSPDTRHIQALRYGQDMNRVLKDHEVRESKERDSKERDYQNKEWSKALEVADQCFHMENKNGYLKGRLRKSRDPIPSARKLILAYDIYGNKVYDARN